MADTTVIRITTTQTTAQLSEYLGAEAGPRAANDLARLLEAVAGGVIPATIERNLTSVKASGTATFTAVVATDALTVNGVAFTCVASGATGNQFNKGASETASAAACVAKINAATDATIAGIVTAAAVGAVITITAVQPGISGNAFTLVETGGHITLSAANLASGSEGTVTSFSL